MNNSPGSDLVADPRRSPRRGGDAGWGERRLGATRDILDHTPTNRHNNEVIEAHATLAAECRRAGHGLQAKRHAGDRWVAACAVAKDIDLLAGDGIYLNAPNLSLLN